MCACVLTLRGNEGVQSLYIYVCVPSNCALSPHPWRAVWGILCRFCSGGRWVLGVLHSDVIIPDNSLVKAGILRAPSPFDCLGQLWRNGHYLPVSSSIKKPPFPSYSCISVPTGGGTCGPVTHWSGESESNQNTGLLANMHSHKTASPHAWTTLSLNQCPRTSCTIYTRAKKWLCTFGFDLNTASVLHLHQK